MTSTLQILDLSYNEFTEFPREFTGNLVALKNVYFQFNALTSLPIVAFSNVQYLQILDFSHNRLSSFELWISLVQISADFSSNNISRITNDGNFNISGKEPSHAQINLSNNGPIDLNDGIYEMYGACSEVQSYLSGNNSTITKPIVTLSLYNMNFENTLIRCSCDDYYIVRLISGYSDGVSVTTSPLSNATCTDRQTKFINFNYTNCANSSTNFSALVPRLCKIDPSEPGATPIYASTFNYTERTVNHSFDETCRNDALAILRPRRVPR